MALLFKRVSVVSPMTALVIGLLLVPSHPLLAGVAGGPKSGISHTLVGAYDLPDVPGKKLTVIVVKFAPGAKSAAHHHSGFVFAYVLSGAVRSQLKGEAVRIYRAGERFIEPPGSTHVMAENASSTQPASMLVSFIADDGAKLTAYLR